MSKNGTVKPINWVWVATNISKNINPQLGPRQISLSKRESTSLHLERRIIKTVFITRLHQEFTYYQS